jgi:flagellar protein FliO/FliZ
VSGSSVAATLLRLVVSLAVVLALMALLARFLKTRQLGGSMGGGSRTRARSLGIAVLSRQGVGRTASVTLVEVAGKVLLLGVTETTVSVLRELTDEMPVPEREDAPHDPTAAVPAGGVWPVLLEQLRERTARRG